MMFETEEAQIEQSRLNAIADESVDQESLGANAVPRFSSRKAPFLASTAGHSGQ